MLFTTQKNALIKFVLGFENEKQDSEEKSYHFKNMISTTQSELFLIFNFIYKILWKETFNSNITYQNKIYRLKSFNNYVKFKIYRKEFRAFRVFYFIIYKWETYDYSFSNHLNRSSPFPSF